MTPFQIICCIILISQLFLLYEFAKNISSNCPTTNHSTTYINNNDWSINKSWFYPTYTFIHNNKDGVGIYYKKGQFFIDIKDLDDEKRERENKECDKNN